jgi:glyoxylase I family protein
MGRLAIHHVGLSCNDPLLVEEWYAKHFGFQRKRVYEPGADQVVMIAAGDVYLELFPAKEKSPVPPYSGAGPEYPGSWRHIAFLVDDLDEKLRQMGDEAHITLGPLDMGQYIHGAQTAWVSDPEGNIVELNQGYVDE